MGILQPQVPSAAGALCCGHIIHGAVGTAAFPDVVGSNVFGSHIGHRFIKPVCVGVGWPAQIHTQPSMFFESLVEAPMCMRTWFVHRLHYVFGPSESSHSGNLLGRLVAVSKAESCELVKRARRASGKAGAFAALAALQSIGCGACSASPVTSAAQPGQEVLTGVSGRCRSWQRFGGRGRFAHVVGCLQGGTT